MCRALLVCDPECDGVLHTCAKCHLLMDMDDVQLAIRVPRSDEHGPAESRVYCFACGSETLAAVARS